MCPICPQPGECETSTLGRLRLAIPIEAWIRDALDQAGLRLAPLSINVALDAGLIPPEALANPFDRLLVAGARQGTRR